MSHKTSPARRAAFLKALRETGNQTIAAERAKVSRSWVHLHRSTDAAFDAAVRAAIAEAKASLSRADERKPPSGWGHLDGEELVVKGSGGSGGGRRVQIARARLKQWTPRIEDRFLATLAATCNVKAACAQVGMTQASAYLHRRRWPAFAKRWDAAIEEGAVRLEFALLEYAMNPFSSLDPAAPAPIPPMRADQALQNLHMHQRRLHGIGGTPGLLAKPPPIEKVHAKLLRNIGVLERGRRIPEEERERDRQEYASRRPSAGSG